MRDALHRSYAPAKAGNVSLRNYLYYSTLIGVFSAILTFNIGVGIRLFDLIMVVNLFLMFLLLNFTRIPAWIPCFLLYLAVSGGIGIANGTDSISQVAKEFLGISVSLLYYYFFFKLIGNDFERAFFTYARIAYWFAIIGILLWAFLGIAAGHYERLHSLASEPAAFCELVLPAYYWYAYLYFTSRKYAFEVIVFSLAIVLSGSSLGFLSGAFGAVLLLSGRKKHFFVIPIAVAGLLGLAYAVSSDFRLRVDDTLLAAATEDVTSANDSTYALISNVFVTQQVLIESPLLGNGLGSHPISHERFISDVPGVDSFIERGAADLNANEAASLTLRVLSELGILGFLGLLTFLFYFHVSGRGPRAAISNAILVCYFLKLIRGGLYFQPEQFFFAFIYILNHRKFKCEVRTFGHRISLKSSTAPILES
jgi:hypothetical protein